MIQNHKILIGTVMMPERHTRRLSGKKAHLCRVLFPVTGCKCLRKDLHFVIGRIGSRAHVDRNRFSVKVFVGIHPNFELIACLYV